MLSALRTIPFAMLALATTLSGCAGTLPELVYANQVDAYFPEPEEGSADADGERTLRLEAGHCAARLNGHRGTAETVSVLQAIISGIGGATGGVGGALSAVDWGNRDITTAMGVMGSIGAGITLAGNIVLSLLANPAEELRLHAQGQRSWELALALHDGHADTEAVRTSLHRCVGDEAPTLRVLGSGPAYAE